MNEDDFCARGQGVTMPSTGSTAMSHEVTSAVRTVLLGFDEGVFVRSIDNDNDPMWAMKLLPYVQALGVLAEATADYAVDPERIAVNWEAKYAALLARLQQLETHGVWSYITNENTDYVRADKLAACLIDPQEPT